MFAHLNSNLEISCALNMDDNFLHIILIMFSLLLLSRESNPIVVIRILHIVTTPMICTDVNIEVRERWHALNLGEKQELLVIWGFITL